MTAAPVHWSSHSVGILSGWKAAKIIHLEGTESFVRNCLLVALRPAGPPRGGSPPEVSARNRKADSYAERGPLSSGFAFAPQLFSFHSRLLTPACWALALLATNPIPEHPPDGARS